MNNINPNSSKDTFSGKASSALRDEMIGFINRNAELSETISNPTLINPLGAVINKRMAVISPRSTQTTSTKIGWGTTPNATPTAWAYSAPGIMVAEFIPIFGSAADFYRTGERSIFIDKWTEFRQIYSGVENFQPGDLQAVTGQLMHLQMQLAHAERTLRIMQTALPSASSKFNDPEVLLRCCGWSIGTMKARS